MNINKKSHKIADGFEMIKSWQIVCFFSSNWDEDINILRARWKEREILKL